MNIEALIFETVASRGMALFFASIVILIAMQFMGRNMKTFAIIVFAVLSSRGLMRIIDETDIIRIIYSIPGGIEIGIVISVLLLAVQLIFSFFGKFTSKYFSV